MSTRGCIARVVNEKKGSFKGRYHHFDSYESGLGKSLFELRNGHFKGDTNAMLKVLIDEHTGWSTICGTDFTKKIGYIEKYPSPTDKKAYEEYDKYPKCYCHGDRKEKGDLLTQKHASAYGCEYVYAFTKDGKRMLILSSYCEDGQKMIGMFGCGDPKATWKAIGEIDLDNPKAMDKYLESKKVVESV
jgi:hypothetical protein